MRVKSAFSVTKALQTAVGSLLPAWRDAWLVLVLLFVATIAGPLLAVQSSLPPHLTCLGVLVVTAVLKLMAQGALYRSNLFGQAARSEGLGFGGVQIGRPELRLLVASLVIAIFFMLIAATVFIVFAIALNLSGLSQGYENSVAAVGAMFSRHSGVDAVFIAYFVAAWLFLLFVAVRFTLAPAATFAERRLVTLNALGHSTGNVGKLFVGILVIGLPFAAGAVALEKYVFHKGAESLPGHLSALLVTQCLLMALAIFVLLPLMVGFFASAYRQITANRAK